MSAPTAVSASAGSAGLLFTSSILNPLLAVEPVGMWAKASISPPFRACSGGGGSGAGQRSRSSTYPQAFLVDFPRRTVTKALMLALIIVEAEPGANASLGLGNAHIGVEVNLLIFEAAPQSLDEDVVHAATLAVHADHDLVPLQGASEVVAGELAAPRFREGRLWSVLKISGRP